MRPHWTDIDESQHTVVRVAMQFLEGRLEERETIAWALGLKPNERIKRLAVLELLDHPPESGINEPWRTAWRLVEEGWTYPPVQEGHTPREAYEIERRLGEGERTGSLVKAIVGLVAPRLKVESLSEWELNLRKAKKVPKKLEDLLSIGLTSEVFHTFDVLKLENPGADDQDFLVSLGQSLESVLTDVLNMARRFGWDMERPPRRVGRLLRVYVVPPSECTDSEPDRFHEGIAPSVKLLCTVVSQLADIAPPAAAEFMQRWRLFDSPFHLRLWAALSRDPRLTPADEVGAFLMSLDDRPFWEVHYYPEIAELRARRFEELDLHYQQEVATRIRRLPPRRFWQTGADAEGVKEERLCEAVRELLRVEIAGASLPRRTKAWLETKLVAIPGLVQICRVDDGFTVPATVDYLPPAPDGRYDLLTGENRLKALETAFSSKRGGWDGAPARDAADWLKQARNLIQVLADLELAADGGGAYPEVWGRLCGEHTPESEQGNDLEMRQQSREGARVLALLAKLPEKTVSQATDGISEWLSAWRRHVGLLPGGLDVWLRLWPIAVEFTNAQQPTNEEVNLNTVVHGPDDREPMDLDTLNTPAGKLVGVFLATCPDLQKDGRPFAADGAPRRMRNAIVAATGRSRLIALHRMIEWLTYFLRADQDWASAHLVEPLLADSSEAVALWRAIARRPHLGDILGIIGGSMVERATDSRLGRESRRSLASSLVIECLSAFLNERDPAVPHANISQMLRTLEDEIRVHVAQTLQRFVSEVSEPGEGDSSPPSPEELFWSAVAPFLRDVWPQERSLVTPGISSALARLPATARGAFTEAVSVIERFLVPFECYSMHDYGLYGDDDDSKLLKLIDNGDGAEALLRLLDLTIGTAEGAAVPYDLANALDRIRTVAPSLASEPAFRRLAAAARR